MKHFLESCLLIALTTLLAACQTPRRTEGTYPHEPVAIIGHSAGPSSQYDVPPKLLSGRTPIYPISRLLLRQPGNALIAFTVDARGMPQDFRVVKADYPYFATHAIIAMRDWRFQPAMKNGKPVAARLRIPFHYEVDQ